MGGLATFNEADEEFDTSAGDGVEGLAERGEGRIESGGEGVIDPDHGKVLWDAKASSLSLFIEEAGGMIAPACYCRAPFGKQGIHEADRVFSGEKLARFKVGDGHCEFARFSKKSQSYQRR